MMYPTGPSRAHDFPTETDMLAQFGLEPETDEFFGSSTYVFRQDDEDTELILTWSPSRAYIAATLTLANREIFTIDMDRLSSLRIISDAKVTGLRAAFQQEAGLPDLVIQIEPSLKCLWITPPLRPDIP